MSDQEKKSAGERKGKLRITKVYTGYGDKGMTMLAGGQNVSKNDAYMHAYGTVDELQAWIGEALDRLGSTEAQAPDALKKLHENFTAHLVYLQHLLFTLSGRLATTVECRRAGMPEITGDHIKYMENLIDAINAPLPPLKDFIMPGGDELGSIMHICRVVSRRAEREIVGLAMRTFVDDISIVFINRVSDLFFVMGRRIVEERKKAGLGSGREVIWDRDPIQPPMP